MKKTAPKIKSVNQFHHGSWFIIFPEVGCHQWLTRRKKFVWHNNNMTWQSWRPSSSNEIINAVFRIIWLMQQRWMTILVPSSIILMEDVSLREEHINAIWRMQINSNCDAWFMYCLLTIKINRNKLCLHVIYLPRKDVFVPNNYSY